MILDKSTVKTVVRDMDEIILFTLYGILYDYASEIRFKGKLYNPCNYLDHIKTTNYKFNGEDHETTEITRTIYISSL